MFASGVLPFQITVVIFVISLIILNVTARRRRFFLESIFAAALLFIPSCIGVTFLIDLARYGKFEYEAASEINHDPYIKLPDSARNIVLHRNAGGYIARFSVTTPRLKAWIEEMRSIRPDLNRLKDVNRNDWHENIDSPLYNKMAEMNSEMFANRFSAVEWKYDPKMHEFQVLMSDRGGGFTVYQAPGSDIAYLTAAYW